MARWTQSRTDVEHIARIGREFLAAFELGPIMEIELNDGNVFEGIFQDSETKADDVRSTPSYSGKITLTNIDNEKITFDLLDIVRISATTSDDRLRQYEEAGIIEISELPKRPFAI